MAPSGCALTVQPFGPDAERFHQMMFTAQRTQIARMGGPGRPRDHVVQIAAVRRFRAAGEATGLRTHPHERGQRGRGPVLAFSGQVGDLAQGPDFGAGGDEVGQHGRRDDGAVEHHPDARPGEGGRGRRGMGRGLGRRVRFRGRRRLGVGLRLGFGFRWARVRPTRAQRAHPWAAAQARSPGRASHRHRAPDRSACRCSPPSTAGLCRCPHSPDPRTGRSAAAATARRCRGHPWRRRGAPARCADHWHTRCPPDR